jgi:hypothetical protein
MAGFTWNDERRLAAQLLADGNLTDAEIAEKAGVDRTTVWRWKRDPEFSQVVEGHLDGFRQEVRRRGIAVRERRVKALNDRWNRLQRIIEARADDPTHAAVPGWSTGLLVHDVKSVGGGENATRVDLYSVDTGLLRELREHEKQAAQELGQWVEKQETEVTAKAYVNVTPDEL